MSLFSGIGNFFHTVGHDVGSIFSRGGNSTITTTTTTMAPPQKAPVIRQPQQAPDQIALLQKAPTTNLPGQPPLVDFTNLKKAPLPDQTPVQPPSIKPKQSLLHRITHNAVTNGVGTGLKDTASVAAGAALGTLRAGEGLAEGLTQLPGAAIHAATFVPRKIAGNDSSINQTLSGINQRADTATATMDKPINWLAEKTDEAARAYGGPGAAVYKPVQVAANVAAIVPGAAALLSKAPVVGSRLGTAGRLIESQKATPTLTKAKNLLRSNSDEVTASEAAIVPEADELAAGLKSTNPAQVQDAIEQTAAAPTNRGVPTSVVTPGETPPVAAPTPVERPVTPPTPNPVPAEPSVTLPVEPAPVEPSKPVLPKGYNLETMKNGDQLVRHPNGAAEHLGDYLKRTAPSGIPPVGAPAPNEAAQAAEAVAQGEPVVTATDVNGNPMQVSAATAAKQAEAAGVDPNPAPVNPAELQAAEAAQAPAVPLQSDRMAPNAPNVRAALEKQLGDVADNLNGVQSEHAVLSNPELDAAAQRVIATLDDGALLDRYASGVKFSNTSETAQGYAALDRLSAMIKSADPQVAQKAAQAIDNILEGAEQGISEGGRQLNYAQTLFDKLPRPAKVTALIRNIDKQREKLELPLVRDDPALQQQVNATIDRYLTLGEDLQQKVAAIEGRAEELQQAARAGKTAKADIKEGQQLQSARIKAQLAVEKNQGDLAQYYDTLVPAKKLSQANIGDATRTLMLSSVAGRLNDPITTGANMLHTLINMGGESLTGKVLNAGRVVLGRNPGKYVSKAPSLGTVARGSRAMLSKSAGEFKGNVYAGGDLRKALQSGDMGGRTQLSRATNLGLTKTRRFIRAGAEFATNLSAGVKSAQLERLASQEGRQLGLKGTDLKTFTAARAASPTRLEEEAGNKLWDEVNNMNDNWITSGLEKLSGAMTHVPIVGQTMKNLTFPFTRWVGGQAYNMITDKNAIANVVKFANAWRKGDSQAMVKNVAGLAQNATAAMTLGYGLAKAGILTTTDAQGYNDNGLYLHLNGRYIPASFLGFFAPSIILGYSTYHGFNDDKGGSVADKVLHTTATTLDATWRAVNGNTLTGQDNATLEALGKWGSRQEGYSAGDAAATVAGQVGGQFIPGIAGDVNAVLNNSTNLNPTHEASLTKVENPNSKSGHATDVPKTALNQFKNRIPGLSQTLPRKAGVAAPDEYDRLFRGGSRDTGATIQAAKDKQTKLDQSKYNAAHDIPDPNAKYDGKKGESFEGAVAARVANNEYDKAIPALQQKLAMYKDDKNVDPKTVDKVKNEIKQLIVTKEYGTQGQDVRKLYLDTSVSEWRDMGDPESDNYNPQAYQMLYDYDTKLAKQGVAGTGANDPKNKFTAKSSKSSKGRSSGSSLVKSNTISGVPSLGMVSLGDLSPRKVNSTAAIPTIQQIQPGQLIKKRAISVTRAG